MSCRPCHFACDCREEFYREVVNDLNAKLQKYQWALEAIALGQTPEIPAMPCDYRKMKREELMERAKYALEAKS